MTRSLTRRRRRTSPPSTRASQSPSSPSWKEDPRPGSNRGRQASASASSMSQSCGTRPMRSASRQRLAHLQAGARRGRPCEKKGEKDTQIIFTKRTSVTDNDDEERQISMLRAYTVTSPTSGLTGSATRIVVVEAPQEPANPFTTLKPANDNTWSTQTVAAD